MGQWHTRHQEFYHAGPGAGQGRGAGGLHESHALPDLSHHLFHRHGALGRDGAFSAARAGRQARRAGPVQYGWVDVLCRCNGSQRAGARQFRTLPRVVATIVPFDVDRITSGAKLEVHHPYETVRVAKSAQPAPKNIAPVDIEPISHYAEDVTKIGQIQWRKRAKVHGRVTSIKTAPRGSAPSLQVEIWDETGGVSLQFLGRREIAGLEVGSQMRAEGMVGEEEGSMVILNPSYELLV